MRPGPVNQEDKGRITIPGNQAWRNVPYLNWNGIGRKVKLNANWDDNRNYNWACPIVRDCSIIKEANRPSFIKVT